MMFRLKDRGLDATQQPGVGGGACDNGRTSVCARAHSHALRSGEHREQEAYPKAIGLLSFNGDFCFVASKHQLYSMQLQGPPSHDF